MLEHRQFSVGAKQPLNAAVWHDLYGVACFREQLRIVSRVLAVKFTFLPPSRFTWKVPNLHIFFSLLKLYLDSFWNELMLIGVGGMDFEGRIRYLDPFSNIFLYFIAGRRGCIGGLFIEESGRAICQATLYCLY